MWVLFVMLILNGLFLFGREFWAGEAAFATFAAGLKYATRSLMLALPTFIFAGAVFDLATFFQRCEEGQAFTERNVKTLKSAGEALFWVVVVSALISPTVVAWIDGETRNFVWRINDLSFGVGAMGIGVFGVANVLSQAVRLQAENDEFV